ncbi:MAG: efflux RND transporter periplasmic adaptor subunit [Proteobacteria bacterium]|nr:efflux RND transporter periplasmic adaptor subunit [Pseudomonadota bacterium]
MADANLAKLITLMKYATIIAPYDGVITQRNVDTGAFVRSAAEGTTSSLLRIAKVDRLRLVLAIPESAVASVHPGTKVLIELPSLGGAVIEGVIARTAFALDPSTRTMRAEVDLANDQNLLQPGMYARVRVQIGTGQQVSTIPSRAIRVENDETYVLIVRDGIALGAPVTIGYDDGIISEVVDGLSEDDWVITSAASAVAEGVPVRAVPTEGRGPAPQSGG